MDSDRFGREYPMNIYRLELKALASFGIML